METPMGKKTDAYMTDVTKLANSAMLKASEILTFGSQKTTIRNDLETLIDLENKRVLVINPGGGDKVNGVPISAVINADPEIVRIGKLMDAKNAKLLEVVTKENASKKELKATKDKLDAKLKEFSAFVARKKAAWTLKSKASIPVAEKFIKDMTEAIKAI